MAGKAQKPCEQCGGAFTARRWWARFCSDPCKVKFHVAQRRAALHEYHLYRQPVADAVSMGSSALSSTVSST